MNTSVIITKEPGQVIPRGYLQEALKKCPTCVGIVIQDKDDGGPLLETSTDHRNIPVDELFATVEKCKDVRMVITLGNMAKDFDPTTDIQPYVFQQAVEGEDPQDILAVTFEGDLPNYSKPGKGHTDEYNFWEDFLFPTIEEKFMASSDLGQFYSKLSASPFEQALMNPVGHRAVFAFIPLEGEIIAFGRNELGGKFEWGTTSNTFGWGSQTKLEAAASTVVDAVKRGGRLAKLMNTAAPAAIPAPAAEPPTKKEENPPGVHTVPQKNNGTDPFAAWPGTSSKTHTMRAPPPGLQGNARNTWIRLFLGLDSKAEMPKNKDHSGFMMPVLNTLSGFAQEPVTTKDSVRTLADKVKRFQGSGDVDQQMQEAHEVEEKKEDKQVQRPTPDFLPEAPAEEFKLAADLVTEWATNPKAPTALEVQRIESKWPLFTVSHGITLANVARWSIADKKALTKKCPNDAARLISELILKIHELGGFDQVNTEEQNDKVVKPAKTPVETTPALPQTGKRSGRLARLAG